MRPLNFILCLAVATHCWAEDNILNKQASQSNLNTLVQIPVTSDNPDTKRLVNLGLLHFILGEAEQACSVFLQAVKTDTACILAHAGILMTSAPGSQLYHEHLAYLNKLLPDAVLTPVEEWYLATFLQYTSGDSLGTAAALKERAALYRRDVFAACWDIVLNHYAGREQTAALTARADELIRRSPENGLVHFCKALLEEQALPPGRAALDSSLRASALISDSPVPHLLAGRLHYNSGNLPAAEKFFQQARDTAAPDTEYSITAQLSLVSTCIRIGTRPARIQALQEARKIAQKASSCTLDTPAGTLLHWEGKTTLLRLLVLQESAPAAQAINAATQACKAPESNPLYSLQECLVEAIRTRSLADANRRTAAIQQLAKAEKHYQNLQRAAEEIMQKGGISAICIRRASQACMAALYRAKIALYPSTKDIWEEHLKEVLNAPQPRFLPPVIPQPGSPI